MVQGRDAQKSIVFSLLVVILLHDAGVHQGTVLENISAESVKNAMLAEIKKIVDKPSIIELIHDIY